MVKSLIPALLVILTLCTGCDAFRKLAGRPTSEDIEIKRAEIARIKAAEKQRVADSIAYVEKLRADSLAAADSIAESLAVEAAKKHPQSGKMLSPSALGGLSTSDLGNRYYVIIGAFKEKANAEKMLNSVSDAGFPGTIISFRNGMNAVGICQTNSIDKAFESLDRAKKESFCPPDAWILVNE